ncbi:helix-turn-helix domain-containing protein [Streptomyces sioyaensis]|uniref:helix-turn-helix domain-containing protein n=1 Tax=Streptomyces sioyaensis TaxID=67364 RepID=UPI0037B01788
MTRSLAAGPDRHFARLAEHLTALRHTARLPQRALAEAANISRGTVQRAESITAAPSAAVLDAYLRACKAGKDDQNKARLLHTLGRTAQRGKLRELKAPAPALVRDVRDLGLVLAETYERAGAPSLSDARLIPGHKPLPRTTAWRIVNRKGLPASREQLITFLTACGIRRPAAQRPYIDAYQHVIAQRGTRPVPPRTQLAQRVIRRSHPVPLARGGADTGARYDLTALAACLTVVGEAIAADRARYDLTALAAGVRVVGEAIATLHRSASREAHRNGTTAPDWITATNLFTHGIDPTRLDAVVVTRRTIDDHGIDLIAHTAGGGTTAFQIKNHQQRPGPPPALPGARVPQPPPPAAAARVA